MNSSLPVNAGTSVIRDRIEVIQVLRGVAVIMVMVFHLKGIIKPNDPFRKELDFLFNSGPAGVDLFFIISGFIMVYITKRLKGGIKSCYEFLIKRVIRIWPLYTIVTLTYVLIMYRYTIPADVLRDIPKSILFIPLSVTSPPFLGYPVLSVGWSLNYEIYFYILIALSLLFGRFRWHIFFLLIFLTLVLLPLTLGGLTLDTFRAPNYGNVFLNLVTNPIIWNFVYGVFIGLLYISPTLSPFFQNLFKSKTVLFTIFILAIWQYVTGFYGGHGPHEWGFGLAILFFASIFYNRQHSVNYPDWLIYLGDTSFSIYLWHLPVAQFITYLFRKLSLPAYGEGTGAFFLTISMTLIASHLSYQFLETKLNNFLLKRAVLPADK